MNFKEWLLNEGQNIKFVGWSKNGTIIVRIDNTRYVFITDAAYHHELQKLAKYKPWTALNRIKYLVQKNLAIQSEPTPIPPEEKPPEEKPPKEKPPVQRTLFDI